MPEALEFEILIDGSTGSIETWHEAQGVPIDRLPKLSDEQREFAKKFGMAEEDYARSYWSLLEGTEKLRSRAKTFGEFVNAVLGESPVAARLEALYVDVMKDLWSLRIRTGSGAALVGLERELVDDFLDSGSHGEAIKARLISAAGKAA